MSKTFGAVVPNVPRVPMVPRNLGAPPSVATLPKVPKAMNAVTFQSERSTNRRLKRSELSSFQPSAAPTQLGSGAHGFVKGPY